MANKSIKATGNSQCLLPEISPPRLISIVGRYNLRKTKGESYAKERRTEIRYNSF